MSRKIINCLYSHFKDSPKKLKIICDWDEVIQAHEPYALWKAIKTEVEFKEWFKNFWRNAPMVKYSPYGSKLEAIPWKKEFVEKQIEIKNSPSFYQEAPFLSIAKELLMLIKAGKVEQLIFLSAYDEGKFPNGDERKKEIFKETFAELAKIWKIVLVHSMEEEKGTGNLNLSDKIMLVLIGFDSEEKGVSKSFWIKENASDFDLVVDDNPNICRSLIESNRTNENKTVLSPYYPAVAEQHHPEVLLVKTSVSDLTKEDFK